MNPVLLVTIAATVAVVFLQVGYFVGLVMAVGGTACL